MKKLFVLVVALFFFRPAFSQDTRATCIKINELNNAILSGKIKKAEAAKQFKALIKILRGNYPVLKGNVWVFPLQGYQASAIGGSNGNGYTDKGYHYFDGNKHAAHPAHDIFIIDKNHDDLDDRTGKPVNVLAVDDGVVIACSNEWAPTSSMRGGKFIWIYHPRVNIISYYAHNRTILVMPGDVVKQCQQIAEVGRTGYNAYKKRSPTHLHFSAFKLDDDLPVPYNPYVQLKQSKKR
jgi:murein DD-endopeptidase MepM/ murein hydrolase activator NlpD